MAVNQHESRGSIASWIKAALFFHETLSRLLRNKFKRWETRYINHFPIVYFFFYCFKVCWQHCTKYLGIIGWIHIPHHSRHPEMVGFSIFSAGGGSHLFTPPFPLTPSVAKQFCRKGGGAQQHQGVAMRYQKTLRGWYALLCREIRGISGSRSERTQAA